MWLVRRSLLYRGAAIPKPHVFMISPVPSTSPCSPARHLRRLSAFILLFLVIPLQAAPLSGTRRIGPTGNYASITAAIADVQAQTLGGALILELEPSYVSTVETFPLTIPALNGASAVNTLTLRPRIGAVNLVITSANTTAATVDLSGAQFLVIDGRAGGTGTAKQLAIANTSTAGVALRFINEASGNTLRYTTLQGVNTSATSGVVVFSTTAGANGNDNNTLDICAISGSGASTPANGIYSLGTTTTPAQNNSANTIANCNVFNFHATTGTDAAGVRLDGGNTGWTFIGNSFYQTATRAAGSAFVRPIYVNNISGNNFTVTGNFIGGNAASAGSTPWMTSGTQAAYGFVGIHLNVGTIVPSSVQGNFVRNIAWTSGNGDTFLPGVWSGIYVQAGSANIGTVAGNTIGGGTGTGSVSVTASGLGFAAFGICSTSTAAVTIANNTVGSITVNGTTTNVSASLVGIQVTAGPATITNNTVGSIATANSLNAVNSSTSPSPGQQVTGILSSSNKSSNITGNTVANLNNNYTGTNAAGQIRGIVTSSGPNTIIGNTVHTLSTTSRNPGTIMEPSVVGISQTSTSSPQSVSQNLVHSLANTTTSAGVTVTGILYSGPTGGTNVIARNRVHSLEVASQYHNSGLVGMLFRYGAFTAKNNKIRVGINAAGASTASGASVVGILDVESTARGNFHHNSIYVGGTQIAETNDTFAMKSHAEANDRTFQNNIFINARSNSGGIGHHYAVAYGPIGNPAGLTAGGNIFLASGTGGVLGSFNNADRATLAAWQAVTGQDTTSAVVDPLFVNPTGTAATVDLHLQPNNPAASGALSIATVTDDFDGQPRSGMFADVGADAGDFTLSGDVFPPGISYPQLTSGSTANRVLTGWATITDNVGISSNTRLYYKKSTDADAFGVANDATGNGWKHVTAAGTTSPYSFTIDYTLLNGGSVTPGETIQYFVVAQDAANNLGSSPAGASASANPPVQNVNAHGAVNSYDIVASLSGTKTVGAGGDYPNLGGLFSELNGSVLAGNLVVNLTSDLIEDGSAGLNPINSNDYPQSFTLTLQPGSATMRTISGSGDFGLIKFDGADHVTIDGRFGDTGRYLTFRNSSANYWATTILFNNDASSNIVRNCNVEGAAGGPLGVIGFGEGVVTGNDDNLVTGCQVRDLSTVSAVPNYSMGSRGSSAVPNSRNTIANNELFNFNIGGIHIASFGNESWTISGNDIHEVNASNGSTPFGIDFSGGGTNSITGNFIHDLTTNVSSSYGISFRSNAGTTTVARNRITAFQVNAVTEAVIGISAEGGTASTLNLLNNQITLIPAAGGSSSLYGLYDRGVGGVVNVSHNTILIGGIESGTRNSWASYHYDASKHTARNNILFNLRTGGTGSHFAAGREGTAGIYTASNNVYAGTGSTPASFMDFSTIKGTPVPVTFAAWQTATGDVNSSAGIAGSGNFTAALFANATTGDLHLVPGGNSLVNATGIPIAGVTDDYDGDPRSATTPNIGSDEFPQPVIAFTDWATSAGLLEENAAPSAMPYHDGIENLLKYAFNLNGGGPDVRVLSVGGTAGLPRITLDASGAQRVLRVEFLRRRGSGLIYTPQRSSSLNGFAAMTGAEVVTAIDAQWERVTVEEPAPYSTSLSLFARVQVTLP